jgi:hypothetical protein
MDKNFIKNLHCIDLDKPDIFEILSSWG